MRPAGPYQAPAGKDIHSSGYGGRDTDPAIVSPERRECFQSIVLQI